MIQNTKDDTTRARRASACGPVRGDDTMQLSKRLDLFGDEVFAYFNQKRYSDRKSVV